MMKRQRLQQIKAQLRQGMDWSDPEENTQLLHALVDHGLEALTELEGGPSVVRQRAELADRERQVRLALADLLGVIETGRVQAVAESTAGSVRMVPHFDKARFVLEMVEQMLRAKGPAWHRQWDWYTPRIAEEFDPC